MIVHQLTRIKTWKEAATRLDARALPMVPMIFIVFYEKDESYESISYSFKVKDGKMVL